MQNFDQNFTKFHEILTNLAVQSRVYPRITKFANFVKFCDFGPPPDLGSQNGV
jgi:hypothetical protein